MMRWLLGLGVLALIGVGVAIYWVERDAPEERLGQLVLPDAQTSAAQSTVPKSWNPQAVQQRLEAEAARAPSTEPEPETPAAPAPSPFDDIGMPMDEIAAMAMAGDMRAAEEMVTRIELCQLPEIQDQEQVRAEMEQARTTHILWGEYIHDRDELEQELADLEVLVSSCWDHADPDGSRRHRWRDTAAELGSVAQSYLLFDPPGSTPIHEAEFPRLTRNVLASCTARDFGTLAIAASRIDDQPMIFAAEMLRQARSDNDDVGAASPMSTALYGADLVRADDLVRRFRDACDNR